MIEIVQPADEMQHALVELEPRRGEAGRFVDLDEAPAPQRFERREGAPVRFGSAASAKPKLAQGRCGWPLPCPHSAAMRASISTPAASSSTSRSNALNWKSRASVSIAAGAGIVARSASVSSAAIVGVAFAEQRAQARELGHQQALVGLSPIEHSFWRVHVNYHPLIQERRDRRRLGRQIDDRALDAVDAQAREVRAERRVRNHEAQDRRRAIRGCPAAGIRSARARAPRFARRRNAGVNSIVKLAAPSPPRATDSGRFVMCGAIVNAMRFVSRGSVSPGRTRRAATR